MDGKNNSFPLEIKDIEPEVNAELLKHFTGERSGFIYVGPKRYCMPHKYREEAAKIYNLEIRPNDVIVASYPRSGTTWTQELVWMVTNDLNYAKSDAILLAQRYTFIEYSTFMHPEVLREISEENKDNVENQKIIETTYGSGTKYLDQLPLSSPRYIKTHLPLSLLPPNMLDTAKVVYVARDPRDVAVSFYHLCRSIKFHAYIGDFKTYWNYFIRDLQTWSPFFEHIKESWRKRHHPNMLFLFYEELTKDLPTVVRRVCTFFNKQYTDDQIAHLCEHLNFDNFKNNKSVNFGDAKMLKVMLPKEENFVRKGMPGGWRDYFDDEMTQQAECWIADNLRNTDLRFPHMQN